MGDRSWNYSRSYGGGSKSNDRARYTSSSGNNFSYTRSGEQDRNHNNGFESSYTRSSSRYDRDQSRRNKYDTEDFNNMRQGHGVSRNYHHHNPNPVWTTADHNKPITHGRYPRDIDYRQNFNSHGPRSQPERSHAADVPSVWEDRRSRSPSAYMNPFPPRRTSNIGPQRDRLLKSPSPPKVHGDMPSRWSVQSKVVDPVPYSAWSKPDITPRYQQGQQSDDVFNSKFGFGNHGEEVEKLANRLKEYVPWLTSRKSTIFQHQRDKELKQEVDDIDWCLDVMRDIRSNENVGMQTLKRAQNMMMTLISKGPVTQAMVTITIADEEVKPDGVCRDDIYSARSPSPPTMVEGSEYTRRSDRIEGNPRVIPTDRDHFDSVIADFPPSYTLDKLNSSRSKSSYSSTSQPFMSTKRDDYVQDLDYNAPTFPSNSRSMGIGSNSHSDAPPHRNLTPVSDEKVYDYGHGQCFTKDLDEELYERRKPKPKSVIDEEALARKAEEERRLKQWEESSEDEDILPRRWNNDVDDDMRFFKSEYDPRRRSGAHKHPRFNEIRNRTEPEDISPANMLGFTLDMINPFKPPSPKKRPVVTAVEPLSPSSAIIPPQPYAPLSQCQGLPPPQSQSQSHVPLHLMNMNPHPPLFNPFVNPIDLLQTQAQLLMRYPAVPGAGLLPLPTPNITSNNSSLFGFSSPTTAGAHTAFGSDITKTQALSMEAANKLEQQAQEDIMMSRIKARAAESFNSRGPNKPSTFVTPAATNDASLTSSRNQEPLPQLGQPLPQMGPPAQILDPRLKPRQPRDFVPMESLRVSNPKNDHVEIEPPVMEVEVEHRTELTNDNDSDNELRIDLSPRLNEVEDKIQDEGSPKHKAEDSAEIENSIPSVPPDAPEAATTMLPEKEETKPSLSAATDELIKSLLFSSLSAEEAEVLNSSEDYLVEALAKLKEEISAKVKERNRKMSGDSHSSGASASTVPGTAVPNKILEDAKDQDDPIDDNTRSRRSPRRKPQPKRRSSLERLHDALREMNFDSMMPLGRRRNLAKLPTEEHPTDSSDQEKSAEIMKEPISVLDNFGQVADQDHSDALSHTSETMDKPVPLTKKRKYIRKKGRKGRYIKKNLRTAQDDTPVSKVSDECEDSEYDMPSKKQKFVAQNEKAILYTGATITTKTTAEITADDLMASPNLKDTSKSTEETTTEVEPNDSRGLVVDNSLNGSTDADCLVLNQSEDFSSTQTGDGLSSLKVYDSDFSADDFVIDEAGLEAIQTIEVKPDILTSTPTTVRNNPRECKKSPSVEGGDVKRSAKGKKKGTPRGVTQVFPCDEDSCEFSGTVRKMVTHYVNSHPGVTIPHACLTDKALNLLQQQNKSDSPQLMEVRFSTKQIIRCIFCNIVVSNIPIYFEHLSSHTGEFRFSCSVCDIKFSSKPLAVSHCRTHKANKVELANCLVETKRPVDEPENEFYGYICRECKYFQISPESIRAHLDSTKHSETEVACVQFKGDCKTEEDQNSLGKSTRSRSAVIKKPAPVVEPPVVAEPPVLVEEPSTIPVTVTPQLPSPETIQSIFCPPRIVSLPEPPKIQSAEVSRFTSTKRSRISGFLDRFIEEEFVTKEAEQENELLAGRPAESDADIVLACENGIQWMVDTVCCNEEMDNEIQNLATVINESEVAFPLRLPTIEFDFPSIPFNIDGTLTIRNMFDESMIIENTSDYSSSSSDEEEEPTDFYVDEMISTDSESNQEIGETKGNRLINHEQTQQIGEARSSERIGVSSSSPGSSILKSQSYSSSPASLYRLNTPLSSPSSSQQQAQDDSELVVDLEGEDLYRCGNADCEFSCATLSQFKVHNGFCRNYDTSRGYACAHCERSLKTLPAFYEHINRHGKCNVCCAVCSFMARHPSDMKRHFKTYHKFNGLKGDVSNLSPPCDSLWFPKEIYEKRIQIKVIQKNPLIYLPCIKFLPNEVDAIPKCCITVSNVHCALCNYSTKVRVNMLRHLDLHKRAEENSAIRVPDQAPVNPVPWLERKELMFDKMTNWAGSTHTAKASIREAAASIKEKLPQFVADQFRYVCSVRSCGQITVDDSMLRAHMRALHSEYDQYQCPHCQLQPSTRSNPLYTVPVDKLGTHLKLHGPKLLKCAHCDFIHIQTKLMEKHVFEKHSGIKPSHYLIRNLDGETGAEKIRNTVMEQEGGRSARWKCTACKVVLSTWERAKEHIRSVHKANSQFMCDCCQFQTDSLLQLAKHSTEGLCASSKQKDPCALVYFLHSEVGEENTRFPIWRRTGSRDHLRGIYYLPENEHNAEQSPIPVKSSSSTKIFTQASSAVKAPVKTSTTKVPTPKAAGGQLKTIIQAQTPKPSTQVLIPRPPKSNVTSVRRKQVLPSTKTQAEFSTYLCCQCGTYKTKGVDAMKTHLRQHLDYHRFTCRLCGNRSWTMSSFTLHIEADHGEVYNTSKHIQIEPRNVALEKQLEYWMSLCLRDPLAPDDDEIIILPNPQPTEQSLRENNAFCDDIVMLD